MGKRAISAKIDAEVADKLSAYCSAANKTIAEVLTAGAEWYMEHNLLTTKQEQIYNADLKVRQMKRGNDV